MSDIEATMAEAGGALPDPKRAVGTEGPLAQVLSPAERQRRQKEREEAEAAHIARAEEMLDVLLKAGEDPNEARFMLGLDPIFSGPEDDPRPWVSYYVPKEPAPTLPPGAAMCPVCYVLVGNVPGHIAAAHPGTLDEAIDEAIVGTEETEFVGPRRFIEEAQPDWVREQDIFDDDDDDREL